jgi:hypothetical protein
MNRFRRQARHWVCLFIAIGVLLIANSAPDGYTMLIMTGSTPTEFTSFVAKDIELQTQLFKSLI